MEVLKRLCRMRVWTKQCGMRAPIVHPSADAFGPPLPRIGVKIHFWGGRFTRLGGIRRNAAETTRRLHTSGVLQRLRRITGTDNPVERGGFLRPLLALAAAGAGIPHVSCMTGAACLSIKRHRQSAGAWPAA